MTVWGSSFAVTKASVAQIPPLLLAFLRFSVASGILLSLAYGYRRSAARASIRAWPILILMGLTGVTLYYVGSNMAMIYTSASQGVLIQSAIPAVTAIFAVVWLKERLSVRRIGGIGVSMLGVLLVVLSSSPDRDAPRPLLGALFMLSTVFAWASYTVLAKRLAGADQLWITTYTAVAGTLLLVPLVLVESGRQSFPPIPIAVWFNVLYLGAISSAGGYLLYNWSLTYLDASQTANFVNLTPVVGVAIAVLFLGETVTPLQLTGGALVLLGVWLAA